MEEPWRKCVMAVSFTVHSFRVVAELHIALVMRATFVYSLVQDNLLDVLII